jgi:hypothetical protein
VLRHLFNTGCVADHEAEAVRRPLWGTNLPARLGQGEFGSWDNHPAAADALRTAQKALAHDADAQLPTS